MIFLPWLKAAGAAIGGKGLMIGGAVIGALLLLVAVYQTGVNAERNRGEAAGLRSQIEALQRDIKVAKDAQNVARKISEANEVAATANAQRVQELNDALAKRPNVPRLSTSDADSLWSIRENAKRRPARTP